ncbi:hypothetical protein K1719_044678 [Acacia pycnantha]|nr:hypothetical protein K1719_044678 [Acacia pycnantha]
MKLKVLIEDNSKLIELYEQAADESNNRIVHKAEDAQEVAAQINDSCSPEGAREEDTESEMKRVNENLQHQLQELNEENEKLMSLYERAMQERDDLKRILSSCVHERAESKREMECPEKLVEVDEGEKTLV